MSRPTEFYTDGSYQQQTGKATYGVYCKTDTSRNLNGSVPNAHDANTAELYSVRQALNQAQSKNDRSIIIHTDSQYVIDVLQGKGQHSEMATGVVSVLTNLQKDGVKVQVIKVTSGSFGNKQAHDLAASA